MTDRPMTDRPAPDRPVTGGQGTDSDVTESNETGGRGAGRPVAGAASPDAPAVVVQAYGAEALLVDLADLAEVRAVDDALRAAPPDGVIDIVPAARTVLVGFASASARAEAEPLVHRAVTAALGGLRGPGALDGRGDDTDDGDGDDSGDGRARQDVRAGRPIAPGPRSPRLPSIVPGPPP